MNANMTNAEKKKLKKAKNFGKPAITGKPTTSGITPKPQAPVASGKPSTTKVSSKPTASTASVKKVEVVEKKKREKVEAARFPTPSANGIPNPLLVSDRNKRALCIAFAHLLGGSKCEPKLDAILVKAIREAGVLWKSGMTLDNFTDGENNSHLSQAEQSGNGYAMRCGRGRHDDYMQKCPEKVAHCLPFAEAFLVLIATEGTEYEALRQVEIDNVEALRVKIRQLQAAQDAEKKSKGKGSAGKTKKPILNKRGKDAEEASREHDEDDEEAGAVEGVHDLPGGEASDDDEG